MIPRDYITEWRQQAPWNEDFQVEQDLVISRALVEIFSDAGLAEALAFRGGTALYKLYLTWLGEAQWKQSQGRVTFNYRFLSEVAPTMRLRLKVEINTREHVAVFGFTRRTFSVESRWYSGQADITTFAFDELLATKLRALYQRRKGRDLIDLAIGLADERSNARRIVMAFQAYMEREGAAVTRAMFERNLAGKVGDAQFNADVGALLRPGFDWRFAAAARTVAERLIPFLPGEPWKGER